MTSFTTQSLYPGEKDAGTHCMGCWIGPTAGLEAEE
jgi:hypothetical protein